MKKMIKLISFMLVLVLAIGTLAGCGQKDDGALSVANWPNAEANPNGRKLYDQRKADFETANPGMVITPDEWKYDVKTFLAKAEGGTLPDLYYAPFTEANKIIDGEYAYDIKNALEENGYYDKISSDMLELIERDGAVYFIPKSCYTLGLAMNLDLMEQAGLVEADGTPKAPQTFEELIDVASTVTEKTGKAGFIFPTTNNQGGWYFTMLGWNYGVEFVKQDKDGNWIAAFDTDDCIAALQYIKDLKWKYNTLPSNTLVDGNELVKQLGSGTAAMSFLAPDNLAQLTQNYGMSKDAIGFSYIPKGPKNHVTLMGGSYAAFANTASKNDIETGFKWLVAENVTPNLTDAYKTKNEENLKLKLDRGDLVGVMDRAIWNEKSDTFKYLSETLKEKCNVNYNHIKLFNENKIDVHTEVEICAQELYGILDACIQEVLTNPDADCKTLIKNAAADFQRNFLDYEN